ncbi:hypothetical protein [Pseudanabaena sp. FACHB-2040]|uniref:hypothetical protein n=1 Tax=Pseudanabaena sp. FACHB-2040 TaxID=2692859 RepID=UPI001F552ECB|nr:hypothetical protein [Pseudanabaena sp. FACHB-2040]
MTTSAEIRSTLVEALQLDLVGPTPGDTEHAEEILKQAPSKWYLTGFLVPFGAPPEIRTDDDEEDMPEELTKSETSEDSKTPDKPPARKAFFPSSMGLSFLVSANTKEIEAIISWGDYIPFDLNSEVSDIEDEEKGKKRKKEAWKRISQKAILTIPVEETHEPLQFEILGGRGLTLVITCRQVRDSRFPTGTLSASVFLVNYRQATHGDRDVTFAFQTCLSLSCPEGFVPRPDPRGINTDDWDEAVASLQYQEDYEFAVGHNVSAVAKATGDHCTEICTTWIPTSEVPRVNAATIKNVQLGALLNRGMASLILK